MLIGISSSNNLNNKKHLDNWLARAEDLCPVLWKRCLYVSHKVDLYYHE